MSAPPAFNLTIPWLEANFPDLSNFAPLSQGGQKLVFSAQDATEGDVVLKLLQPNHDLEDVRREILAVQQVQSEHVPRVFAHGSVATPLGPAYWIREERIHGETLRDILSHGPLSDVELFRLARDIIGAVAKAEAAHIVHRDVKPENIIRDRSGKYWLLDFGIARHLTLDSRTATALPFGKMTLGYSPPEQCRNDKPSIDARSDLFALGVTLYEAAEGQNPFRAGARDGLEILRRVENEPLPRVTRALPGGSEFRDFVAAVTQRRRDHRPGTAAEAATWILDICEQAGV